MESKPEGILHIRDSRTSSNYEIPIWRNTIDARALRAIKAASLVSNTKAGGGLQVYDAGLQNTAVKVSAISSR
jgi:citrate synthase